MKSSILLAATLVAAAGNVHAAELDSFEFTVGTGKVIIEDPFGDIRARNESFAGTAGFSLGERVDLSVGLTHTKVSPFDTDMSVVALLAMYKVTDNFSAGLFFDRTELTNALYTQLIDHYGIEASYQLNDTRIRGFIGEGKAKGALETTLVSGLDVIHDLGNGLDIGAFFLQEKPESFEGTKAFGLSLGAELSGPFQNPIYINASLGRIDDFFGKTQTARITFTLPLGGSVQKGRKPVHRHSIDLNLLSYMGDVTTPAPF